MITVVIPVYNRADVVERTLDSVAAQDLRPLRVVLVDNASTDGSPAVLERWADGHRAPDFHTEVISETRPGAAAARNAGLARVTTDWTLFFDSDDIMAHGHLSRARRLIAENPGADIIGWGFRRIMPDGTSSIKPFYARKTRWHSLFHGSMATLRYMARTDLFRRVGGWNPEVKAWDDIELGDRLLRLRPTIVHAGPEVTVDVYAGAESITGQGYVGRTAAFDAALDHFAEDPVTRRCIGLKRAILAADGHEPALLHKALEAEPSRWHRTLLRAAYAYTSRGGRGAARILYPWFNFGE